jgi:hypothetical protein
LAGTSGTVSLPAGAPAFRLAAISASGGSVTIGSLPPITLPANAGWLTLDFSVSRDEVPGGTSITFTGTTSYVVQYETIGGGA